MIGMFTLINMMIITAILEPAGSPRPPFPNQDSTSMVECSAGLNRCRRCNNCERDQTKIRPAVESTGGGSETSFVNVYPFRAGELTDLG